MIIIIHWLHSSFVLQMAFCGAPTEAASSGWSGATRKSGSSWPGTMTTTTMRVAAEQWRRSWCVWMGVMSSMEAWIDAGDWTCGSACSWCTTGSEWRRRWRTGSKPALTARVEFLPNRPSLPSASAWPTAVMPPATCTPTSASTGDDHPRCSHETSGLTIDWKHDDASNWVALIQISSL